VSKPSIVYQMLYLRSGKAYLTLIFIDRGCWFCRF